MSGDKKSDRYEYGCDRSRADQGVSHILKYDHIAYGDALPAVVYQTQAKDRELGQKCGESRTAYSPQPYRGDI